MADEDKTALQGRVRQLESDSADAAALRQEMGALRQQLESMETESGRLRVELEEARRAVRERESELEEARRAVQESEREVLDRAERAAKAAAADVGARPHKRQKVNRFVKEKKGPSDAEAAQSRSDLDALRASVLEKDRLIQVRARLHAPARNMHMTALGHAG